MTPALSYLYEALIWLLALFRLPFLLYSYTFRNKYRSSLVQKLGIGPLPYENTTSYPSIWLHAVSVGETKASLALLQTLHKMFPNHPIIISSSTETGHAEALRLFPYAAAHLYLPFDFIYAVRKSIRAARPGLILFCESDFWFRFLSEGKKEGAALAIVNGKLSERSMKRWLFVPSLAKALFQLFDQICIQNPIYLSRFLKLGINRDKLAVTGNLKFDTFPTPPSKEEKEKWLESVGIPTHAQILTIASTHHPEEMHLAPIIQSLTEQFPSLYIILVPRHPERSPSILSFYNTHSTPIRSLDDPPDSNIRLLLINRIGLLLLCYACSNLAIVGGSFFESVGGHNILEPCAYGVPVLFGPFMHSQEELVGLCLASQAGEQISLENLERGVRTLLSDPVTAHQIGANGIQLIQTLKGTTQKTLDALEPVLKKLEEKQPKPIYKD